MDAAAHKEVRFDRHVAGLYRFHEIIQDLVGNGFMESAFVPVAPKIELEAFQLHAEFVGHIADTDRGKIRLAGLGAEAREFRALHLNIVIPAGIRILEDFEFL